MNEPGSLINPENFDRLMKAKRIFGSAQNGIDLRLFKALQKMVESEYPCALVRLKDTRQLWFNEKLLEHQLEIDVEEGIGRDLTDYWLPGDHEYLVKSLVCSDVRIGLDLRHTSVIFPPVWGRFYSHFERVDSRLGTCRLTFFKEIEETPNPLPYKEEEIPNLLESYYQMVAAAR